MKQKKKSERKKITSERENEKRNKYERWHKFKI